MEVDTLSTPFPSYIPRYTGHIPQKRFRCGHTFAVTSHQILVDPTVNKSKELKIVDRSKDVYPVRRVQDGSINLLKNRAKEFDALYWYPTLPGYLGMVPKLMNSNCPKTFAVCADEAENQFAVEDRKYRESINQLEYFNLIQKGDFNPRTAKDKQAKSARYELPLHEVRPQGAGVPQFTTVAEPYLQPNMDDLSMFFLTKGKQDKYLLKDYAGYIPYQYHQYGSNNKEGTNAALRDFTLNFVKTEGSKCSPVYIPWTPPKAPATKFYHENSGMIPNYAGHVPGETFGFGQTFGAFSKNAKRWHNGATR